VNKLPLRFWIETALGAATGVLLFVTLFSKTWIEQVFGVDPDKGNGTLEWGTVVALFAVTVAIGFLARREWQRLHAAAV
jgi:hypothetical protein